MRFLSCEENHDVLAGADSGRQDLDFAHALEKGRCFGRHIEDYVYIAGLKRQDARVRVRHEAVFDPVYPGDRPPVLRVLFNGDVVILDVFDEFEGTGA